jgi:hypothetical protein
MRRMTVLYGKLTTERASEIQNVLFMQMVQNLLDTACRLLNPLNAELNPICHLLALLGTHPILRVSRIRVKHRMSNHSCSNL